MPPSSALSPLAVSAEEAHLGTAFVREVHDAVPTSAGSKQRWIALAKTMLAEHNEVIDRAQLLVLVDRNPHVQTLFSGLQQAAMPSG